MNKHTQQNQHLCLQALTQTHKHTSIKIKNFVNIPSNQDLIPIGEWIELIYT